MPHLETASRPPQSRDPDRVEHRKIIPTMGLPKFWFIDNFFRKSIDGGFPWVVEDTHLSQFGKLPKEFAGI
jgi:hypothetical protein